MAGRTFCRLPPDARVGSFLFRSPAHILQRLPFLCLKKSNVLCSINAFQKQKKIKKQKKNHFYCSEQRRHDAVVSSMPIFLFACANAMCFFVLFFHSHATGDERQCVAKKGMFNEPCELILHSSIFRRFC